MNWILGILVLVGLIYLARQIPKTEGAKASGIEDFNFPSAAERPIQVVFGTRKISGPNVLWYGDLKTTEITEKVKTLFRTTKTVVGHKYYMGVQLGICHGPDVELKKIIFDDIVVVDSTFFGESVVDIAPDDYVFGGAGGKISFYSGSQYQSVNSYLSAKAGDGISRFKGLCYVVLESFWIGNSPNPQQISFEVARFPKAPRPKLYTNGFTGNINERIGADANPAFVVYELLTDKRYGAGIPKNLIDSESFLMAGSTLYGENFGISLVIDSAASAGQIITEIMKVIQGNLIDDPKTGKIRLKLTRNDYGNTTIPELNPSNLKAVSSYTSGSLDTGVNEIRVKYLSREHGYEERTAIAQNNALRMHKGDVESQTISMPQVTSAQIAAKIAQRELVAISSPMKSCVVECTRAFSEINVGDVVSLTWPFLGVESQVMRVTAVNLGSLDSGGITMNLVQDVYGVFSAVYSDGSERAWTKPTITASNVTAYEIIDSPALFADGLTDAVLLMAEAPANAMSFKLLVQAQNDSSFIDAGEQYFTKTFISGESLSAGIYSNGQITISGSTVGFESYSESEGLQGMGLYLISSGAGREWIYAKSTVIDNATTARLLDVKRGIFNTRPLAHPVGAKIWAAGDLSSAIKLKYTKDEWISFKMLTKTATNRLKDADATVVEYHYQGANSMPWRPGRLRVNGVADGGLIIDEATLQWRTRDGSDTSIVHQEQDKSQLTYCTYVVTVADESGILRTEEVSAEAWTFDNELELRRSWYLDENNQLQYNEGTYADSLTFTIKAKLNGQYSDIQTITVNR
ncbi:phage tail protein [Ectopseudomonas oleovorans]|uniref:phage tail protein n=1 Tax=Ectopseudomonas oleovorans TaxID=301 RepID=UPI0035B263EB